MSVQTEDLDGDVETVLRASRVIAGIVAESLAAMGDRVTLLQLRTLVLVATRYGINAGGIPTALAIHPSNATRIIARLVQSGLLSRHDSAVDRRTVELANRLRGSDQSPQTQLQLGPHHDRHHRRSPDLDRTRSPGTQPHQDRHPHRLKAKEATPAAHHQQQAPTPQ